MRKVILFIAMSLDGFIARKDGQVDWLDGYDDMGLYEKFVADVDTVIMGWNTYHQIVHKLSPDQWVYDNMKSYVITHRDEKSLNHIIFTQDDICHLVHELKCKDGKNIWLCGGAQLIHQFIENDLIDEYRITIIPTLLGEGISLFQEMASEKTLKLIETKQINNMVELIYIKDDCTKMLSSI